MTHNLTMCLDNPYQFKLENLAMLVTKKNQLFSNIATTLDKARMMEQITIHNPVQIRPDTESVGHIVELCIWAIATNIRQIYFGNIRLVSLG